MKTIIKNKRNYRIIWTLLPIKQRAPEANKPVLVVPMALAMEQVMRTRGSAIVMLMMATRKTATQWEVVVAPVQWGEEKGDRKWWKWWKGEAEKIVKKPAPFSRTKRKVMGSSGRRMQ